MNWKIFDQDELIKINSHIQCFPIDNGDLLHNLIRKPQLNQTLLSLNTSIQTKEINDNFSEETKLLCRKKIKIDEIDNHQNNLEGVVKLQGEKEEKNEENVGIINDISQSLDELKQDLQLSYHIENSIQYISGETLVQTMKSPDVLIYDCRYQYEFQGGHIKGAIHLNNFTNLFEELFGQTQQSKKIVVLYCEFSIRRSQERYFEIRKLDRSMNKYPKLTYNNLYLLNKGYSEFYKNFQHMCNGCYISMNDPCYEQELEQEQQIRNIMEQKKRLKNTYKKITGCFNMN